MDFNTQRKAVAAVERFGKKYKIFYPLCMLAVLCIALFCSAVRAVDMALSDDDGRFLGMNRSHKKHRTAHKRSSSSPVSAEKKGFFRRALSGFMAACFAVMVVPSGLEIVSFAASSNRAATAADLAITSNVLNGFVTSIKNDAANYNYKNTIDVGDAVKDSFTSVAEGAFNGDEVISYIDLSNVKAPDSTTPAIGKDAFKDAKSLTTVIIDASKFTVMDPYFDAGNDPFDGISEDAVFYIKNVTDEMQAINKLSTISGKRFDVEHKVVLLKPTFPSDITSVEVLPYVEGAADVYVKVTVANSSFSGIKLYERVSDSTGYTEIETFTAADDLKIGSGKCLVDGLTYTLRVSASNIDVDKCICIAARTYTSSDIYSIHYTCSNNFEMKSPDAQSMTFTLSGLDPAIYWNSNNKGYIDYYLYKDDGLYKKNDAIETENASATDVYTSEMPTITEEEGYLVYLLEVYDPLGKFNDPDNYTLVSPPSPEEPGSVSTDWKNGEFFYYRITANRLMAKQLPSVSNILYKRNAACENEITFTWDKTEGENNLKADGYYVYFGKGTSGFPELIATVEGGDTTSYTYHLPDGFSSGVYSYNVIAYKQYGDFKQPGLNEPCQILTVDSYLLTTESINQNEIVLKWSYPDTKNSTNKDNYDKTDPKNFRIDYSYIDGEGDEISGDFTITGISPDAKGIFSKTFTTPDILTGTEYTFSVTEKSANSNEHFFSSNKAKAMANKELPAPEVGITNGNRKFTVTCQSENLDTAGFHIRIYTKNTDGSRGDLVHDAYLPAELTTDKDNNQTMEAESEITELNKASGASPINKIEYIVDVSAYSHSGHENSVSYPALPDDPYNPAGLQYKPYPIEHEYDKNNPDQEFFTTAAAVPTNSLELRVDWDNQEQPYERGALLTWNTVNSDVKKYKVTRQKLVDGKFVYDFSWIVDGNTTLGGPNKFTDNTAAFANYYEDGSVKRYNTFRYQVESKYDDLETDPMPSNTYEFTFDPDRDVSLTAPREVKVVGSDGEITVSWKTVESADRYNVYRKPVDGTDADRELVATIYMTGGAEADVQKNYVDHPLNNGVSYEYTVSSVYTVAENNTGDSNSRLLIETDPVGEDGTSGSFFPPVTGLTGTTTDGQITLKWDKHPDKDVEYYVITAYRYDKDGNPDETPLEYTVNGTTYTLSGLTNGDTYKFTVEAVKIINGQQKVTSEPCSPYSITVGMPIYPPTVQATPGNRKVVLTWEPNPQSKTVDGYYIMRAESTNGEQPADSDYVLIASTNKTTYPDGNLTNGTTYWYKIQAYKSVSWNTIVSDDSIPVHATPDAIYADDGESDPYYLDTPMDFTVTAEDGTAHLSWSKVDGAEGYRIYMIDNYGMPVLLGTSSKNKIDYTGLVNGEVYTYTVTAYKTLANGEIVESGFAIPQSVTIGTYLAAPVDVTAVAGDSKVTLSWSAVTGATGYVVYAYNAAKNSFTAIGVVSKPGFVHEGLENGLTYSYMIVAYKTVGLSNQYSQYSLAVSATPHASGDDSNSGGGSSGGDSGTKPSGGGDTGGGGNSGGSSSTGYNINIVGTVPEGISHSELITAYSDEMAFNQDIDIRFSVNTDTSKVIYDILAGYADGLDSFDVYPFDISAYIAGTTTKVQPAEGHYVTITMPVPDSFRNYGVDYQVIHVNSAGQMEVLALTYGEADGIPLVQFAVSEFSPFAFVHYYTPEDLESQSGASAAGAMNTASAGPLYALRYTGGRGYSLRKRNRVYKLIKK